MKLESRAREVLIAPIIRDFGLAADDVVRLAQARAPKRTGRFARSIQRTAVRHEGASRLVCEVGSPLVSARAKEKGALISAKRGRYLVFNAGSGVRKVTAVRLRPQPSVTPAGRQFTRLLAARLRRR